jgi:hypothetical protein
MKTHLEIIRQEYKNSEDDSTNLFQTILSVAEETGMDIALSYLEQCVTEKRLAWLDKNLKDFDKTGNPVADGYRLFYEIYLGVTAPGDGEIMEQTEKKIVMRWQNSCPTLEVCNKLGLDTREVCKKAYHQPVSEFLKKVNPGLRFDRNYDALRPHQEYCEEMIILEE